MEKKIYNPLKDHVRNIVKEIQIVKNLVVRGQKYAGAKSIIEAEEAMNIFAEKMQISLSDESE